MYIRKRHMYIRRLYITVEAFPGGRDTNKKRDAPDPQKKRRGPSGPRRCFFWGAGASFLVRVTRPPRTLVGAVHWFAVSLWGCRVSLGLPCLCGVAVSLWSCRVNKKQQKRKSIGSNGLPSGQQFSWDLFREKVFAKFSWAKKPFAKTFAEKK